MIKKNNLVILVVLLLAGFLRLHQISAVPPGPSLDEVSIGFNAKLLGETGRDEYGYRLPLLLRAYDDWRPALYVYLVIPFVKLLGMHAVSVRLPAVALSLLSILVTFLLVQEILFNLPDKKKKLIALFSVFLLAVSPWHVYLSRLGHEVNLGLTVTLLFLYFFFKFVHETNRRQLYLVLTGIFWSLSFYAYQNQKIISPLLAFALLVLFKKEIFRVKKTVIVAFIVALAIFIPAFLVSLSPNALVRFRGTSIFLNNEIKDLSLVRIARDDENGFVLGKIFDNRRLFISNIVLRSYLSHFDPTWLFLNTGRESHKIPNLGLFYLWEIFLLVGGAYLFIKEKGLRKEKIFVIFWLIIAPLPGAITTQAPHAMRSFNILPVPQLLSGFTLASLLIVTKLKKLVFGLLTLIFFTSGLFLYHNYFHTFPYEQSDSFQVSLQDALRFAIKNENKYQKIVVTNKRAGFQSYMFYLYLSDYSKDYLSGGGTVSGGFDQTHLIGKYEFRPIDWGKEDQKSSTLFIGNHDDFANETSSFKLFNLLDGQPSIMIVSP